MHADQTTHNPHLKYLLGKRYPIKYAFGLQNSHARIHMKSAQIRQIEQRAMFQ